MFLLAQARIVLFLESWTVRLSAKVCPEWRHTLYALCRMLVLMCDKHRQPHPSYRAIGSLRRLPRTVKMADRRRRSDWLVRAAEAQLDECLAWCSKDPV